VFAGLRREVAENCALLGDCAASSGNFLPTFWDSLSFPSSEFKNPNKEITTTRCVMTQKSAVRSLLAVRKPMDPNLKILLDPPVFCGSLYWNKKRSSDFDPIRS